MIEPKYESRDYERQDRRDEEEIDLTTRDRTPLREQDGKKSHYRGGGLHVRPVVM